MRGFLRFGIAMVVAGCGSKKHADDPPPVTRLELGDCASVTAPFVSGPRPMPWSDAQLASPAERAANRQQALDAARNAQGTPGGVLGVGSNGGAFASLTGTGDISTGFDDSNIYGGLLGSDGEGTGRGIGTGRYGTIGDGAGSGYGVGAGGSQSMRRRPGAVPTVSIGQPNAQGDLDKAIIRRYIKRNIAKITYCYEKQLLVKPTLQGTVATQFFITPDGKVASATAAGVDPEVANCVADVIKGIEFPKPRGGGGVQVNYPFTFRPAGGGSTVPIAAAGSAGSSSAPQPEPDRNPNDVGHYDMKPITPDASGRYAPGATSPLHDQEHALLECVRALGKPYGAIVVDLTYDAAGGVTKAKQAGIDDKAFATCVEAAAMKVKRTDKTATAQRCGAAFGVMPAGDLPTIAITATDVMFNGAVVDHVKDIVADDSSTWRISALFEALDAWTKRDAGSPLHLRGPGMLEPLDATPMKIVSRALATSYAAGADFVLAVQRGGTWQPLREVVAPVVPVPMGTGASWNGTSFGGHGRASDDERVVLSILVANDRIRVGLSRVDEFQDIAGRDWTKLEATLREHKASAFFADRVDVEVAGADDATYGDVVKAIEVATRAGFSEWRATDPAHLSARPQP